MDEGTQSLSVVIPNVPPLVPEHTVLFDVCEDGAPTPFHITVARVTLMNSLTLSALREAVVADFGPLLGATNPFYVVQNEPWGKNSFLVNFMPVEAAGGAGTGADRGRHLDAIRRLLFTLLVSIPDIAIVKRRYAKEGGLCPQHVDTHGVRMEFKGRLTFEIRVV